MQVIVALAVAFAMFCLLIFASDWLTELILTPLAWLAGYPIELIMRVLHRDVVYDPERIVNSDFNTNLRFMVAIAIYAVPFLIIGLTVDWPVPPLAVVLFGVYCLLLVAWIAGGASLHWNAQASEFDPYI